MRAIEIEPNCRLFYEDDCFANPWESVETVLLIHGGCESSAAWFAWVPHLARKFRVIRIDLRGHGGSSIPSEKYQWSPSSLARDVGLFLDRLGIREVHVVGAKIGGMVAFAFAAQYPDRVRSVCAIGTPLHMERAGSMLPKSTISEWVTVGMDQYVRENMQNRLGSQAPVAQKEWWEMLMLQCDQRSLIAVAAFADIVDMRDMLPKITSPALLLTNENNNLVSHEAFEEWRSKLPNGELVIMPVDGFHIAASHPDECAEIVMRFIRNAQARAAEPGPG